MAWDPEKWATWPGDRRDDLVKSIRALGHSFDGWQNGKPVTDMADEDLEPLAEQVYYGAPGPPANAAPKPKTKRRRGRPRKKQGG